MDRGMLEAQINAPFWDAELLVRRARLAHKRQARPDRVVGQYRQALESAVLANNMRVMVSSAHAVGFELAEWTTSMRELAHAQFHLLRGTELSGGPYETLGHNLYEVWSASDYRRLSERDLETKQMLMDSAKEMKAAQVPSHIGQAAMIMLLTRLFHHAGPAEEWARDQVEHHLSSLPDDVRNRLRGASAN
jgi:hypothetical protein